MNNLPYKSTKPAGTEQSIPEKSLPEEIIDLPGLIHSLDTRFRDVWISFGIRQPIGEVRDFGNQLVKLGKEHNAANITRYGIELVSAADSFNIEVMLDLIKKYVGIIGSLKGAEDNKSQRNG